jgi:hypothetical protein
VLRVGQALARDGVRKHLGRDAARSSDELLLLFDACHQAVGVHTAVKQVLHAAGNVTQRSNHSFASTTGIMIAVLRKFC